MGVLTNRETQEKALGAMIMAVFGAASVRFSEDMDTLRRQEPRMDRC